MLREQLIEHAAESYNKFAEELKNALESEPLDIEKLNRLLVGLKTHRKTIKILFLNNFSLKISNPDMRETIKKIRDDVDPYKELLKALAKKIIELLREKEWGKEEVKRLVEGFIREEKIDIDKLRSIRFYIPPVISEELIEKIQDAEESEIESLLEDLIEELEEETMKDYYEDFGDWLNEIERKMGDFEDFFFRLIKSGAIVVSSTPPSNLADAVSLFDKVRECYMCGLYDAAVALCRTVLEECFKKYYKNKHPEIQIDDISLGEILKKINLSEELKKEIYKVKKKADRVIHGEKTVRSTDEALYYIRSTTRIVEAIFE